MLTLMLNYSLKPIVVPSSKSLLTTFYLPKHNYYIWLLGTGIINLLCSPFRLLDVAVLLDSVFKKQNGCYKYWEIKFTAAGNTKIRLSNIIDEYRLTLDSSSYQNDSTVKRTKENKSQNSKQKREGIFFIFYSRL